MVTTMISLMSTFKPKRKIKNHYYSLDILKTILNQKDEFQKNIRTYLPRYIIYEWRRFEECRKFYTGTWLGRQKVNWLWKTTNWYSEQINIDIVLLLSMFATPAKQMIPSPSEVKSDNIPNLVRLKVGSSGKQLILPFLVVSVLLLLVLAAEWEEHFPTVAGLSDR